MNISAASTKNNSVNSGLYTLPLRLVCGWLFFSAFWRRIILEPGKLNPDSAFYIGHQFNHFLPHAIFIKPMLMAMLNNINLLQFFLIAFTIIEGLVGLALILGLGTRLASFGMLCMSWGILCGAGWLGTTCLDEWQIGCLGIAGGMTLMLSGSGPLSLDILWQEWISKIYDFVGVSKLIETLKKFLNEPQILRNTSIAFSITALFWTLVTNQMLHGGIWGKLHNFSARPHVTITDAFMDNNKHLNFTLFADGGPDTYGSFMVDAKVKSEDGKVIMIYNSHDLATLRPQQIKNHLLVKAKTIKSGLSLPLGSLSNISLDFEPEKLTLNNYKLYLTDVSGTEWSAPINMGVNNEK